MLAVNSPRLMIVEDNAGVRDALLTILCRHQMSVAAHTDNGVEAVALYCQHHPNIVLVASCLPKTDGRTVTQNILAEFPQARIIVLTLYEHETVENYEAGAKAVMLKDVPPSKLTETIRTVHGKCGDKRKE